MEVPYKSLKKIRMAFDDKTLFHEFIVLAGILKLHRETCTLSVGLLSYELLRFTFRVDGASSINVASCHLLTSPSKDRGVLGVAQRTHKR
jgi:hypothetical protein